MKRSALKISSYAKASFMEDQAHELLAKLSDLWQSLASVRVNHLYEDRLYNVKCRAYYRYVRRCNITSDILNTQQIASVVEREAFPNSGDTFAAPLNYAPVLAVTKQDAVAGVGKAAGQGSTIEQGAVQGSGSICKSSRVRLRRVYPGNTLILTVYSNWARMPESFYTSSYLQFQGLDNA